MLLTSFLFLHFSSSFVLAYVTDELSFFCIFLLLHLVLTYLTDVHGLDFAKSLLSVNAPLPSLVQLPKLRRARRLLDKLQVRILMYMTVNVSLCVCGYECGCVGMSVGVWV